MSYEDDTFDENDFYGTSAPIEDEVTDDAPEPDEAGHGEVTDEEATEATDEVTEEAEPTPDNYFDPTEHGDKLVKLKVDGEEVEIPLKDALAGTMMRQDYTRKTQEVAFWKQVDQAMRADPQATLEYLAKNYGVATAQAAVAQQQDDDDDDWGNVDPRVAALQQELAELKQVVLPMKQAASVKDAEAELVKTVEGLTQKYGDDFNAHDVITEAINRGIRDPSQLETVFRDMTYDTVRARAAAQTTLSTTKAEADAAKRAAAAQAAAVVSSGGGASKAAAASATPARQPRTPREAVLMAMAEQH